jgi:hypothetical protein
MRPGLAADTEVRLTSTKGVKGRGRRKTFHKTHFDWVCAPSAR